jgi:hypothetical protein
MTWMLLTPGFLLGALAVSLPILLHFLRRQPTAVNTFPTLVFLARSLRKKSRFHSIRRWLVLLARCAVLGLLALAFARPFFARPFSSSATAVMIFLDDSYSMGAGGQFAKSQAAARRALDDLGPGDLAGLILADARPRLAVPLGHDRDAVLHALDTATLSSAANDYDGALRLADTQLAASPSGTKRIELFGDRQELAWQAVDFKKPLSAGVQLKVAPAADRHLDDVSVDDVKVAGLFTGPNQAMTAVVKVHNRSETTAQQRQLHLELDGKEVASANVSLRPGESADLSVPFRAAALQPSRGLVRLDADAFPINDTRYFALNPATPLRVGLRPTADPGEVDLLAVALDPSPDLALFRQVQLATPADLDGCDAFVLRPGDTPDPTLSAAIVAAIRNGKPALVFADNSHAAQLALQDLGISSSPRPASDDPLHFGGIDFTRPEVALFADPAHGDLFQVRFNNPPVIQMPDAGRTIASFEDGTPAIAEVTVGRGAVLLVATGLDRASTTWPLRSTFLPFVQESLGHLANRDAPVTQVLVGEALPGQHPGVTSDTPGVVSTTQGGAPQLVAVNLDPAESDLTTWTNDLQIARLTPPKSESPTSPILATMHGEEAERHQRFWWYAILTATVFLFLEIFLANRTPL